MFSAGFQSVESYHLRLFNYTVYIHELTVFKTTIFTGDLFLLVYLC